ncbi:DUF421 domain-containing protein [Marininema halotolerans]|uniref:Uncharacterized membrane protein YcaP, DUF421 family n=1 Tax=Marininema halotolerans TaxID=1155944 RepID=A0A1I6R1W3_9BACL|nr:DUF421 domain-containing protein [Marininema halotolerans]SFS58696.1 Uncharacterized membrane protein YcaP, DUF421 family [Marininema halotolerans]
MGEGWSLLLRTLFIYFFVLLIMRLMGKREIGKLSVFDVVVSIMIADFAVMSVDDLKMPLFHGLIPIMMLAGAQILLSFVSLKSPKIRRWIDGEPTTLIKDGQILEDEMEKQRYNMDDLMLQLREKNIANIADVEFAVLETSGKLSVFPKDEEKTPVEEKELLPGFSDYRQHALPVPLIIDGKVQEEALRSMGQTRFWLKNQIQQYGYKDLKEIFFVSIDARGRMYIDSRKDKR